MTLDRRRSRAVLAVLALLAAAPPAAAQGTDASFFLINRGSAPVRELFVTPAGDADWGRNRLIRGPLPQGGQFEVKRRRDGNCIMDIRAVFADGRTEERRGLNTCTLDAVAVGEGSHVASSKPADDPSFRLVNRGSQPIVELYATPSGMTHWGENRLADGALPAAAAKRIDIVRTGNCLFDLKVVFTDHKALEKHHADLCRTTDLPVP